MSNQRPPGAFGDGNLADPSWIYKTGASEIYGPGTDHKLVLQWCLPPAFFVMAESVSVTVRVRLEDPNTDSAVVDLSGIFGTLTWGSGQADGPDEQVADFDCVGSARLTAEAWTLNVAFTYPPSVPTSAAINPIVRVDVSVALGKASGGPSPSATRTVVIGGIPAANASADFQIPQHATGARIVSTDLDTAIPSLDVRQKLAAGGPVVSIARVGKLEDTVPVARGRGARWFNVANNNGGAATGVAVIFDLTLS